MTAGKEGVFVWLVGGIPPGQLVHVSSRYVRSALTAASSAAEGAPTRCPGAGQDQSETDVLYIRLLAGAAARPAGTLVYTAIWCIAGPVPRPRKRAGDKSGYTQRSIGGGGK